MTLDDKIQMVETLLGGEKVLSDDAIQTYLSVAEREILAWRYGDDASTYSAVPPAYEMTQVQAVLNGFSQMGAEGQTYHGENGINRTFEYADMVNYIRRNVVPMCGVPR